MRGCWEERPRVAAGPLSEAPAAHRLRGRAEATAQVDPAGQPASPARTFVPVELLRPVAPFEAPAGPPAEPQGDPRPVPPLPLIVADLEESWADRTSLFGDLDRSMG